MADCMEFPKTADEFIEQYKFTDAKQEYTNGAELISVFRVKQMMEHYFATDNHVGGKKTQTNADRIRAMSDEELADFLYEGAADRYCKNYPKCGELLCTEDGIPEEECKRCLLSWLLQSAEAAR